MNEYIMRSTSNGWGEYVSELIRCKDCKFFSARSEYGHGLCDVHCNGVGECEVVNENDYCSKAEVNEE